MIFLLFYVPNNIICLQTEFVGNFGRGMGAWWSGKLENVRNLGKLIKKSSQKLAYYKHE